jgi:hypothetical protein
VNSNNPVYSADSNGVLYADNAKTVLWNYPIGKSDVSYSIASTVITVNASAFYGSQNITSLTVPTQTINTITNNNAAQGAFSNMINLNTVNWYIGNGVVFNQYAFSECRKLVNFNWFPNGSSSISYISPYTFRYTGITNFTIPNCCARNSYSVAAFQNYGGGTASVQSALQRYTVNSDHTTLSVDSYGVLFNNDKTELRHFPPFNTETSYTIPSSVTRSPTEYAFFVSQNLKNLYVLNNSMLTNFNHHSFRNSISLQRIDIPSSITNLGDFLIYNVPTLKIVNFKTNTCLRGINYYSFLRNSNVDPYFIVDSSVNNFSLLTTGNHSSSNVNLNRIIILKRVELTVNNTALSYVEQSILADNSNLPFTYKYIYNISGSLTNTTPINATNPISLSNLIPGTSYNVDLLRFVNDINLDTTSISFTFSPYPNPPLTLSNTYAGAKSAIFHFF